MNEQYFLCKQIYEAFRDSSENDSFDEFVESILTPYKWACSKTIMITSMFLQTDIIMVSNVLNTKDGTAIPELFKSSIAFSDRFGKEPELISNNNERIYIYLHLCNSPLQPAPLIQLNHFCGLQKSPRKIDDFNVPVNIDNTIAVYLSLIHI